LKHHVAKLILIGADFLFLNLSLSAALWLSQGVFTIFHPTIIWASGFIMTLFFYHGLYQNRYDFWHESRIIIKTLFFSFFLLWLLTYLFNTSPSLPLLSNALLAWGFGISAIFLPTSKRFLKRFMYRVKLWRTPAKIFGEDSELAFTIFNNPYLGYEHASKEASTIFINSKNLPSESLKKILLDETRLHHHVIFIPIINEFDLTHAPIYELTNARSNLFCLENRLKNPVHYTLKSIIDYLTVLVSAPITLPLICGVALLIKLQSPNEPIFFKQKRVGQGGKLFTCYKFRTMYMDSEDILNHYLEQHPEEVAFYEKYHKYNNDPRITPIGGILRRTSLDELPQLFNVLKYEMSLVGPRPYLPGEMPIETPYYDLILSVKPGITGLWQTSGRNALTFKKRTEIDVWYIRNWSLWLDITIYLKTIKVILSRSHNNKAL